jgi:MoaA/NifB/PqqE/SkfB family radical SAM enzyme
MKSTIFEKLRIHRARLYSRMPDLFPKSVDVYITDKCNLKCLMCNIGAYNRGLSEELFVGRVSRQKESKEKLSVEDCAKIAREVRSWNAYTTLFATGGEPLLVKDKLFALFDGFGGSFVNTGINTNGYLLDQDTAKQLVDIGLGGVTISIDGPEQVHDQIRGVSASFRKALVGKEYLDEEKKKRGSMTPHVMTLLAISPHNYRYLFDTIQVLAEKSFSAITFSHYVFTSKDQLEQQKKGPHGVFKNADSTVGGIYPVQEDLRNIDIDELYRQVVAVNEFVRGNSELKKAFKFSPDLRTKEELETYYLRTLDDLPRHFHNSCLWVRDRIDIDAMGDIMFGYPCFKVVLGNVRLNSIKSVWRSKQWRELRKDLMSKPNMPVCLRCCGNRRAVAQKG